MSERTRMDMGHVDIGALTKRLLNAKTLEDARPDARETLRSMPEPANMRETVLRSLRVRPKSL